MEGQTVGLASIVGNYADCFGYWMYTHGAHFEAVHLRQVRGADLRPGHRAQLLSSLENAVTTPMAARGHVH